MTTAFPGAIDNFTNPTAGDPLDSVTVPHASQHADINDAVEAIENATLSFGYTTGFYYRGLGGNFSSTAVEDETIYFPFKVVKTNTFDRIAIATGTTYVGTGSVRLGIYNNSTTTGKPTTVVLDAGTVATTAASTVYQITISQSLTSGNYWLAFNMQTAASTPLYISAATNVVSSANYISSTTGTPAANAGVWLQASVTGAFATAGTLTSSNIGSTCTLRST